MNQRKASMGEKDERRVKKASRSGSGFDGAGEPLDEQEEEREESDGDMEEAGGMDDE